MNNCLNRLDLSFKDLSKLPNSLFPINSNTSIIKIYISLISNLNRMGDCLKIQEGLRIPKEFEVQKGDEHILKQYQFSRYGTIKIGSFIEKINRENLIKDNSIRYLNCLKSKIVIAEDALRLEATYDNTKSICQGGVYFASLKNEIQFSIMYILGILNSNLINKIYRNLFSGMHMAGGYLRFRTTFLNVLPIKYPDLNDPYEKQMHEKMVSLVGQMLEMNKRLDSSQTQHEKELLKRRIYATDRQIDKLVYELYGLTEEEIKIVEKCA